VLRKINLLSLECLVKAILPWAGPRDLAKRFAGKENRLLRRTIGSNLNDLRKIFWRPGIHNPVHFKNAVAPSDR
jgi:hypothetical protein